MTKVRPIYLRLLIFSAVILGLVQISNLRSARTKAGSLSSTSVTMSNSRLSYRGQVNGDFGSSNRIDIIVDSAITNYVDGTDQYTDGLGVGDSLEFTGSPTPSGSRTIEQIVDANTIRIDASVLANETFYMAQTTDLTAEFTTNTYVAGTSVTPFDGGYFEVLVPAIGTAATSADDTPDQFFFDAGSTTPSSVSCSSTGAHTFDSTGTSFGDTGFREGDRGAGGADNPLYNQTNGYQSDYWHAYRCSYTGGDASDTVTMVISNLINPAPKSTHDTGVADTYDVIVRHMNGKGTAADFTDDVEVDVTWVKIGAIEAVQVSARVLPSLTFEIDGVAASTSICGITTDVATSADQVPLGDLSTGAFTHAGQLLTVTTNAVDGAAVTAIANDQLGRDGGACAGDTYNSGANAYTCIWDANVTSMTHLDSTSGTPGEQNWDASSSSTGFGFALDDTPDTTNEDFTWGTTGEFYARHFADYDRGSASAQDPQLLFDTNNNPTNDDDCYVCYRAKADALTAAGNYYNYITYTATATF
jgi:hypothetical protein